MAIKVIVELQAKPGRRDELKGVLEDQVSRIVITHAVEDVERRLGGKAERAGSLPGATNVTDLVGMDGSSHAAVVFEIDDLDALKAVLSSVPPEVAAQAESHGVIMPMTVYVEA